MSSNHFLPPLSTNIHDPKPREKEKRSSTKRERTRLEQEETTTTINGDGIFRKSQSSELDSLLTDDAVATNTMFQAYNPKLVNSYESVDEYSQIWPEPFDDAKATKEGRAPKELPPTYDEIRRQVEFTGNVVVRVVTWNQEAKHYPAVEDLVKHLIPQRIFHVVAVGTQECENDFCRSVLNPSKAKWETRLAETLGPDYKMVCCHALQASHIAVCVHKAIVHLVSDIKSHAVPTGVYDTLGNKGGIGVSLKIGISSFCFLNAHLAAHQNQMCRRTQEFMRISHEVAKTIGISKKPGSMDSSSDGDTNDSCGDSASAESNEGMMMMVNNADSKESSDSSSTASSTCKACSFGPSGGCVMCSSCRGAKTTIGGRGVTAHPSCTKINPLSTAFDFVFWAGDFNYRINGTRDIIDNLLENNMHRILINNDQLMMLMQYDPLFKGLKEGPITFRPTYKFDKESDTYDTSAKRRIPSWTDRILYKAQTNVGLISYSSAQNIRTSDHRPVYSTFTAKIDFDKCHDYDNIQVPLWSCQVKSEVCVIS